MRRMLASALLTAVLFFGAQIVTWAGPAPPVVDSVWANRGRQISPAGDILYWERLWRIRVSDADGAADIASITVVDTEEQEHSVAFDPVSGTTLVTNWEEWDSPTPPPPGSYTITVVDSDGNSGSLTTPVTPDVSGPPFLQLVYPATPDGLITEPLPEFQWAVDLPGGAVSSIWVWESGLPGHVWTKTGGSLGTATSCVYNFDDAAVQPELMPGHAYGWQIDAWDNVDIGATDPRVAISVVDVAHGSFTVYSPNPVIQNVEIHRCYEVYDDGGEGWRDDAGITVKDCDGTSDIASVTTLDPEGQLHPEPGADYVDQYDVDQITHYLYWGEGDESDPPSPGVFETTATDAGEGVDVAVTDTLSAGLSTAPVVTCPLNHSTITDVSPTITWDPYEPGPGLAVSEYLLWVWRDGAEAWHVRVPGNVTEVAYSSNGNAPDLTLLPGAIYNLHLEAYVEAPAQTDPRVRAVYVAGRMHRFLVTAGSPAPTVSAAWGGSSYFVRADGTEGWERWVDGIVRDPLGNGNMTSVVVTDPLGGEHVAATWDEGGWPEALRFSFYEQPGSADGIGGAYVVTVTNAQGYSAIGTAVLSQPPASAPAVTSPGNGEVLPPGVTQPVFSWDAYPDATRYSVCVRQVGGPDVWGWLSVGQDTTVQCGADLAPGEYEFEVVAHTPDDEAHRSIRFVVYSPNPVIQQLQVDRGRDVAPDGSVSYHERVSVLATDCDGIDHVALVTVTDSEDNDHAAQQVETQSLYTGRWQWEDWGTALPPPPGPYAVTVTDKASRSDSIATAPTLAVVESTPTLLTPPPNNSLVYETAPTFSWINAIPGSWDNLHIWDETTGQEVWYYGTNTETSVLYGVGGRPLDPEPLIPGHTYSWQIDEWIPDECGETDPRVTIQTSPHASGRFTVVPSTPVVPGSNVTVPVDGCDVTFESVTAGGAVYSQAGALPSGDPAGYPVAGYGWNIWTTAVTSGKITVTAHYDDAFIPTGQETSLQLVRWDGSHWVDITFSRDPVNNTLTGECASLGRFAIYLPYPVLPELPGKLAFDAATLNRAWEGIEQYNADPTTRTCLVDGGWGGDLSPDGTSLAYNKADGIWIERLDGTSPTRIPNIAGGTVRWAPDGNRIGYTYTRPDGLCEVRIANTDGSGERVVSHAPGVPQAWPSWSPDGQWIAYRYWLADSYEGGQASWVVRCDDVTTAHPVIATGVAGYPGYDTGFFLDAATWSPDGTKLAVGFQVSTADRSKGIGGIGIISPQGGLITPLFITPPGVNCCASPMLPVWSPDGTKIVFRSGHHLAVQPAWRVMEPGVELWMVNADGTGGPVRLTYDDLLVSEISWRGLNTQPGSNVPTTISDTTITFATVTEPGVTTATVYDTPPAPEPSGFQFAGQVYNISTTAQISGLITVQIHYEDSEVPAGMEQWLSLLHWENGHWVDVTVRPIDTVNNIITGECTSLSPFAVVLPTVKPSWQSPLKNGTSAGAPAGPYKRGSTIPVKFRLLDAAGQPVSDAMARAMVAQLEVFYEKPSATGTPIDLGDSLPDVDGVFRYQDGVFHYNLSTKNAAWLANYTYGLDLLLNGVKAGEVFFSLK